MSKIITIAEGIIELARDSFIVYLIPSQIKGKKFICLNDLLSTEECKKFDGKKIKLIAEIIE